ncbi:MAG: GAF domain-containing sensor histidine kinase [Cyanobacteria bacterium]|nr:GAF domain-containing sensor histidine kinase [Cyanobacteriota bacterium]
MSSIFSGMSASHELVIICQSQLSLLVESLGVSSATVYLTDSWEGGNASQLQRVAVVPLETAVSRNPQLSAGGVLTSRSIVDLESSNSSSIGSDSHHQSSNHHLSSHQIVLPLLQDDRVLGVLVAERNHPWDTIAQLQLDAIRQALVSACILDFRSRWFEQQTQQQQVFQRQQKDLLDNLLHQFRNPLTAMRTFGKLLVKRLVDVPRNQEAADSIVSESDRLQALLVQFERAIEGGGIKSLPLTIAPSETVGTTALLPATTLGRSLNLATLEVQSVLHPAIRSALGVMDDRNQTLQIDVPKSSIWVEADPSALAEVVINLLDNASKYTPVGGRIWVELNDCDDRVELWITDTGYGIPKDDQNRLFERHYRGVQAQSTIAGTGLGLSIARDLMRQMQGEIMVLSPPPIDHAIPGFPSGTSLQVTLRKAEVNGDM